MRGPERLRARFEGQALHAAALTLLVAGLLAAARRPGLLDGAFAGLSTASWLAASVGVAVVHQVYVWFGWRWELHGGAWSRLLGHRAFPVFAAGFFPLLLARPAVLTFTALAGPRSVEIPLGLRWALCIAAGIPLPYLAWSAVRHLGWRRIAGIDHFDPACPRTGLVRRGIFRWSSNALYVFGAPAMWIPGVALQSAAALAAAAFMHAYIWVHYACTERPDLRVLYGGDSPPNSAGPR